MSVEASLSPGPSQKNPLLLASQSPRRKTILKFIGIHFRVVKPLSVSETRKGGESPADMVRRLAIKKAMAVSKKHPLAWVVGADTVVVHRGVIHGKPRDRERARGTLKKLLGSSHEVMTGVALVLDGGKCVKSRVERAKVWFKSPDPKELEAYLRSGEPYDKAGGYDIRGRAKNWIEKWSGDYLTIVGLPVQWLLRQLNRLGEIRGVTRSKRSSR